MSRWTDQVDLLAPTFEEMKRAEPILPPLVLGWMLSMAAAVAMRPLIRDAFAGDEFGLGDTLGVWLWIAALFAPLFQLTRALVLAAMGWATLALTDVDRRLRPILSVLLYGEAVLLMEAVATAVFLHLVGGDVRAPADLRAPFGLAGLVAGGTALEAVLQPMTIFQGAWLLFLWFSCRRVLLLPRGRSGLMVAVLWGGIMAVAALRAISRG